MKAKTKRGAIAAAAPGDAGREKHTAGKHGLIRRILRKARERDE